MYNELTNQLCRMELSGLPIDKKGEQLTLSLSLCFSEKYIEVLEGYVQYALKRCKLRITVDGGNIPLKSVSSLTSLEYLEQSQRSVEGVMATITEIKPSICQVSCEGTETGGIWTFEAEKHFFLKGQIPMMSLGIINITSRPCYVKATLEVRGQQDLHFIWLKALGENLCLNKLAVVERELFLRFVEPKWQHNLIQVENYYE